MSKKPVSTMFMGLMHRIQTEFPNVRNYNSIQEDMATVQQFIEDMENRMKIMIGPRQRISPEGYPYTVFVLGFYPSDQMVITIGTEHLDYHSASRQAHDIARASGGLIAIEAEHESTRYRCEECGEWIPSDDFLGDVSNPGRYTHWRWVPERRYMVECGPIEGYKENK